MENMTQDSAVLKIFYGLQEYCDLPRQYDSAWNHETPMTALPLICTCIKSPRVVIFWRASPFIKWSNDES
jgi:hypothetical protein